MLKEEAEVVLRCHIVLQLARVHLQEKEVIHFGEKVPTNNLEIYHFKFNLRLTMLKFPKQRKHLLKLHQHHMIHISLKHQSKIS